MVHRAPSFQEPFDAALGLIELQQLGRSQRKGDAEL